VHGFVDVKVPIPSGTTWTGFSDGLAAGKNNPYLDVALETDNLRPCVLADVCPDPQANFTTGAWSPQVTTSRLDWVGRNHGGGSNFHNKKTNFLYLDGHVETKSLEATIQPFEWGEKFYSVQ
jgi:prepilin-type processing-associated H-X9-DG protein